MTGSAARLLTGRRTKYLVLVFWLVMVALAGPLAGKLTGVEKNDSASWLPGSAESTKVLEIQQSFQSPNALPAVIVYERPSGLTAPTGRRRPPTRSSSAGFEGVQGRPTGPVTSADGKALQTVVAFDLGSDGWQKAPRDRRPDARHPRRRRRPGRARDRSVRHRRRLGIGVRGHRRHPAVRDDRRRRDHPAGDVPQPAAVAAAGHLGRRRARRRPGRDLPAGRSTPAWPSTARARAS